MNGCWIIYRFDSRWKSFSETVDLTESYLQYPYNLSQEHFYKNIILLILCIDLLVHEKVSRYIFQGDCREVSFFFSRSTHNFSHSLVVSPICLIRYSSVFWFLIVSLIKWLIVSLWCPVIRSMLRIPFFSRKSRYINLISSPDRCLR